MKLKKTVLTIGADPEFVFIDPKNGEMRAANVLLRDIDPQVGLTNQDTRFGVDGHNATAEIRPEYADTPEKLVGNIETALKMYQKVKPEIYNNYAWFGSTNLDPLGGHIHFGHPDLTNDEPEGFALRERLTYNLDSLLGIPIMYLESLRDSDSRKISYGRLGDSRRQPWGIEYRVLPSWLASKKLAEAILSLAYAITYDTIEYGLDATDLRQTRGVSDLFNRNGRHLLRPALREARRQITELRLYSRYQKEIDWLWNGIRQESHLLSVEIKSGWNVNKVATPFSTPPLAKEAYQGFIRQFHKPVQYNSIPNAYIKLIDSSSDTGVGKIASNVLFSTSKTLGRNFPFETTLRLYGISKRRGGVIELTLAKNPGKEKTERIAETIKKFSEQIDPKIKSVRVTIKINHFAPEGTTKLGLPLRVRLSPTILPELITTYVLFSVNGTTRGEADIKSILQWISKIPGPKANQPKTPVLYEITRRKINAALSNTSNPLIEGDDAAIIYGVRTILGKQNVLVYLADDILHRISYLANNYDCACPEEDHDCISSEAQNLLDKINQHNDLLYGQVPPGWVFDRTNDTSRPTTGLTTRQAILNQLREAS